MALSTEEFARQVVQTLRDAGYEGLFAGGCVRDQLLGVQPKDYDVATNARPEQVREIFGRRRTIAIGQSFGVITVLGPKPQQVEVATFRSDGTYSDGRHPDDVTFSTAEVDAARRDFTINGMFYDPLQEQVIDYVGGQQDLHVGLIRAIGNPAARINEDRLRMLRAVRFAATYDFQIEAETLSAIRDQHAQLRQVSQERITHELQRMLSHPNRSRALQLLRESKLLEIVLPPVQDVASSARWTRLLRLLETLESPTFALALAALLGDDGAVLSPVAVTDVCRQWKVSNEIRKTVEWIVAHQQQLQAAEQLDFSQLQPLLIHHDIDVALALLEARARVDGEPATAVRVCREHLARPMEALNPAPLIRGEDLAAMGLDPGPDFASLLSLVRDAQLDGAVHSKNEALDLVRRHLDR